MKLYCIPYSGGSAEIYLKWKKLFPENISIIPVELAGRGKRMKELFYESCEEAVKDLADVIEDDMKEGEKYAILGHSMGSLLAFETYYELLRRGCCMPVHMFMSGRKAPQNIQKKTAFYLLPEEEFLKVVFAYGGSTPAAMENATLRKLFLPILRADFKIAEIYEYIPRTEKIMCPVTILNGTKDYSVLEYDLSEWSEFAGSDFCIKQVEGGHFFIMENMEDTVAVITEVLEKTFY
ncbi:Surfactin synthase thioesterase subunit [Anaeromicropila populeti]|uniref:Surfactin synthase thioesterase subunit n=2 Tax=Anaeromicropila populeti TaxID=37658 RepID=A0A1I6JUC5_9FIRM|nr:Surfactin synthase thioesterase subunit [Anaeromicropila populeti]